MVPFNENLLQAGINKVCNKRTVISPDLQKKGNKNKMFSDCIMRKQTSIDTSCLLSECKATGNSYDIANILYYKEGSTNYKYSII